MSVQYTDPRNTVDVTEENVTITSGTGIPGPAGATGPTGPQGAPGAGVVTGGVTGDLLVKVSSTNYDTAWTDSPTVDTLKFDTAANDSVSAVGELTWNDTHGSPDLMLKGGNVVASLGQSVYTRVQNVSGVTLTRGDVVYLFGASGQKVTVKRALADSDTTSARTLGVVAETIADNAQGYIICEGVLDAFDTSTLTEGQLIWLSPITPGEMTTTKPAAPSHTVLVGVCVKQGSGTSGSMFVKVQNGYELDEIHDVRITSAAAGDVLTYTASALWENTTRASLAADAAFTSVYLTKTIIDAKGDLIVGSAADTVARLPVGATDGHILKVAAAESTGLLWQGQSEVIVVAISDETTAITTGNAKVTFRMPFAMTLTAVRASLSTASSSGTPTFDINESGSTILSTKITIDANELTSTTAATPPVISDTALADDAEITVDVDVAGTGAKGAKIYLIGRRT